MFCAIFFYDFYVFDFLDLDDFFGFMLLFVLDGLV